MVSAPRPGVVSKHGDPQGGEAKVVSRNASLHFHFSNCRVFSVFCQGANEGKRAGSARSASIPEDRCGLGTSAREFT